MQRVLIYLAGELMIRSVDAAGPLVPLPQTGSSPLIFRVVGGPQGQPDQHLHPQFVSFSRRLMPLYVLGLKVGSKRHRTRVTTQATGVSLDSGAL